uniref:N-acetyltransferase domain-containing protein n=1 Tax=Macrostomum lignano TaxID=282301 RepID=A0A1I8FR13_9PLAT
QQEQKPDACQPTSSQTPFVRISSRRAATQQQARTAWVRHACVRSGKTHQGGVCPWAKMASKDAPGRRGGWPVQPAVRAGDVRRKLTRSRGSRHRAAANDAEAEAERGSRIAEGQISAKSVDMLKRQLLWGMRIEQTPQSDMMWWNIVNKSLVGTGLFSRGSRVQPDPLAACSPAIRPISRQPPSKWPS